MQGGAHARELKCEVDQQHQCIAQPPRLLPCARVAESCERCAPSTHTVAAANGTNGGRKPTSHGIHHTCTTLHWLRRDKRHACAWMEWPVLGRGEPSPGVDAGSVDLNGRSQMTPSIDTESLRGPAHAACAPFRYICGTCCCHQTPSPSACIRLLLSRHAPSALRADTRTSAETHARSRRINAVESARPVRGEFHAHLDDQHA